MRIVPAITGAILAAAALSACTDSPAGNPAGADPATEVTTGLRGERIATGEPCPMPRLDGGSVTSGLADEAVPEPNEFLLCGQSGTARLIATPDTQEYQQLLNTLSKPDLGPPGACEGWADQPLSLIAQTSQGAYAIHIPEDGCGHYQRDAGRAVNPAPEGSGRCGLCPFYFSKQK